MRYVDNSVETTIFYTVLRSWTPPLFFAYIDKGHKNDFCDARRALDFPPADSAGGGSFNDIAVREDVQARKYRYWRSTIDKMMCRCKIIHIGGLY